MVDQVRGHTPSASDRVEVEEDSDATGDAERELLASEEAAGETFSTECDGRKFAMTAGRLESVADMIKGYRSAGVCREQRIAMRKRQKEMQFILSTQNRRT